MVFDEQARTALDHYQRRVLIGELSLGEKFEGMLPRGMIDNRNGRPHVLGRPWLA
jgi:hypothetical protein